MIKIPIKHLNPVLTGLAKLGLAKASLDALRCVRVDASADGVAFTATDLSFTARVCIPEIVEEGARTLLVPFDRLQSLSRRLPGDASLGLEPGRFTYELSSNRVVEEFEAPASSDFPADPKFSAIPSPLPEGFADRFREAMECTSHDTSRYILNGVAFDVSSSEDAGHYLVATDGRQLFSANSFRFPISHPIVVPNHKLLQWSGLTGPWAIATEIGEVVTTVRIVAGAWTLTFRAIEGNYPNCRQVLVRDDQVKTRLTFPEDNSFDEIIQALPGRVLENKPVDLVVSGGTVMVKDTVGGQAIPLTGATATSGEVTFRLNRDYLTKALGFGLTHVGIVDATSPLRFTREGRTFIAMPLRVGVPTPPPSNPAPAEPQPERQTMPSTATVLNRETTPREPGTPSPDSPVEKPALEAAIDKLDAFKSQFKETLAGLNDLTALLRQAVRDQKAGEKEIQSVRQTIRSLQSVRI
jgi:DNA polymerase III sliding clamp (beta) subunit (PCNA family)